jgi:hypothetical protein
MPPESPFCPFCPAAPGGPLPQGQGERNQGEIQGPTITEVRKRVSEEAGGQREGEKGLMG